MKPKIIKKDKDNLTIQITIPISASMLSTEEAIQQAVKQAGLLATEEKKISGIDTSVKYVNRSNEVYYLKKAPTKSGKIQHCAIKNISKTNPADLATEIPLGFEFYESPRDAQVYFRKIPVYNISDAEVEIVDAAVKTNDSVEHYIIEKGANSITVFVSQIEKNSNDYHPFFEYRKKIWSFRRYDDVMKFEKEENTYYAERFCYHSALYGWKHMESSKDLRYLAEKYCYHIGKDSFYEL